MQKSNLEDIISIVVPIIFGIVFVIGLIGNSLVVAVVSSNQQVNEFQLNPMTDTLIEKCCRCEIQPIC